MKNRLWFILTPIVLGGVLSTLTITSCNGRININELDWKTNDLGDVATNQKKIYLAS